MNNINIQSFIKPVAHFLRRFHVTIFVVLLTASLAVAILVLNSIQIKASTAPEDYQPQGSDTTFDQSTIDRIEALQTADEIGNEFVLPQNVRTNPFVE